MVIEKVELLRDPIPAGEEGLQLGDIINFNEYHDDSKGIGLVESPTTGEASTILYKSEVVNAILIGYTPKYGGRLVLMANLVGGGFCVVLARGKTYVHHSLRRRAQQQT